MLQEMIKTAEKFDSYSDVADYSICYVAYSVDNEDGGRDYYRNRFFDSGNANAFIRELWESDNAHYIGVTVEYGVTEVEFRHKGFDSVPHGYVDNFDMQLYRLEDGTAIEGKPLVIE